jgi:MFS-type transporter involved in bile tolerance (Atg22 family)
MPIDATVIVALVTGILGIAVVAAIGARYTQNTRLLAGGSALSGLAIGLLAYVLGEWMTRGFNPLHTWSCYW